MVLHQGVQNSLPLVTEGGMPQIVGQGDGFSEILVQVQGPRDIPRNSGHLDGVCQPGPEVIS